MASKSADHTHSNCVQGSDHESAPESDYQDQPAEDGELLEILEQLSETIDTAHNVLAGQQELASKAAQPEQAAGLEIPPPPPVAPARWSGFNSPLAAAIGVFFGVAALWLFWNSPQFPGSTELVKDQDHIARAVVSPSPVVGAMTPPPAAEPEPAAKPLTPSQPAKTAAPAIEVKKDTLVTAAAPADKEPALPPLGKEEETRFLQRGEVLVASGDIASARLAYEYSANRGSADAMFALAQTYDPAVLASWNVVGIEPDISAALEWYGRAAQHGHDPADARASELEHLAKRQP